MIDRHLIDQVENILADLSIPVTVLDRDNATQMGDGPDSDRLTDGVLHTVGQTRCLPVKQPAVLLCCNKDAPGADDVLRLAGALVSSLSSTGARPETGFDVYRRALTGELYGAELEALCHEYQLPRNLPRCAMVFHIVQTMQERAYELLCDVTPLQHHDVLIDVDRHTVALVKDISEDETMEDLLQYGQALQETLMSETARQMTVGIGDPCHTMDELRESYAQARRAIEVGRIFRQEESIFAFSRMILERFLLELPPDISANYHSMLFNRHNARLFNEEMLYTIDMFFKKDLNLSDTARQLYIHRNTLVYRLDKVQRQTGLDLRSFDDAVTFKILMELKKCSTTPAPRKDRS